MVNKQKKVAVVLYGFCRTYKDTAKSLIKNILKPNNADLFIFTYDNSGVSILSNSEDINRQKAQLGNQQDKMGDVIDKNVLKDVYGEYLKDCKINKYNPEKFKKDSDGIYSPFFPIERFYSLYWNISGAINLLNDYVKKTKTEYDVVVLARPDLMFFDVVDIKNMETKAINIPSYGGNINCFEQPNPYYAMFYENIERAEQIPWHQVIFTDQFLISSFENMTNLSELYSCLSKYDSYGLPVCHPETVLYYHLAYNKNISVITNNIRYKILRNNFVQKTNELLLLKLEKQTKISKTVKYRTKAKDELRNLYKGIFSIYRFPVSAVKYLIYRFIKKGK